MAFCISLRCICGTRVYTYAGHRSPEYEILDDSIIVVRAGTDEVRAFHNSCPHRGTQLTGGRGHAKQLVCPFHGWRFGIDGRCVSMVDEKGWAASGLPQLPVRIRRAVQDGSGSDADGARGPRSIAVMCTLIPSFG
jgi:nitrite reductase/ring-hydroxylating ferredoxin subunit